MTIDQFEKKAFEDATQAYEHELDLYKRAFNFIENRASWYSTLDKRKTYGLNMDDPQVKRFVAGQVKAGAAIHDLISALHKEIKIMANCPF